MTGSNSESDPHLPPPLAHPRWHTVALIKADGRAQAVTAFAGLRVVCDVPDGAEVFEAFITGAKPHGFFIIPLADLTHDAPDGPGMPRRAFAMLDAGHGIFPLGNHGHALRRALIGCASAKLFVAL